jgi:hypothetical protein
MATTRQRRSPKDYLSNILQKALQLSLLPADEVEALLAVESSSSILQNTIEIWRERVRVFENIPPRIWVLAVPVVSNGEVEFERIDEAEYESYNEATTGCRIAKKASQVKLPCRVLEKAVTIPCRSLSCITPGRSAIDILALIRIGAKSKDHQSEREGIIVISPDTDFPSGYLCAREVIRGIKD